MRIYMVLYLYAPYGRGAPEGVQVPLLVSSCIYSLLLWTRNTLVGWVGECLGEELVVVGMPRLGWISLRAKMGRSEHRAGWE